MIVNDKFLNFFKAERLFNLLSFGCLRVCDLIIDVDDDVDDLGLVVVIAVYKRNCSSFTAKSV